MKKVVIRSQTERNKRLAFEHLVEIIKKQDKSTVVVNGNEYSYTTKRGLIKKYVGFNSFTEYRNSKLYPNHADRVNGFVFVQV